MNENIEYLKENFYELNEVLKKTGISKEKLNDLIENNLIPKASYTIIKKHNITSSLGDNFEFSLEENYFPKNIISIINRNITANQTSTDFKGDI
jgi:hypothetical protein